MYFPTSCFLVHIDSAKPVPCPGVLGPSPALPWALVWEASLAAGPVWVTTEFVAFRRWAPTRCAGVVRETHRFNWRWLWIRLVPMARFAVYLLVNYRITGDPWTFLSLERDHWSNALTAPWRGITVNFDIARDWDPSRAAMLGTQVLLFLAIGLAGAIAAAFLLRPSYARMDGAQLAAVRESIAGYQRAALHAADVSAVHPVRAPRATPQFLATKQVSDHRMVALMARAVRDRVRPRPLGILSAPVDGLKGAALRARARPNTSDD